MKVITPEQAARLDADSQKAGTAVSYLMARAGAAVAQAIISRYPDKRRVHILVGSGNNGGDGWAAASVLFIHGRDTVVQSLFPNAKLSEAADKMREEYTSLGGKTTGSLGHADIIIDSIFGTGLSRPVEGAVREVIEAANNSKAAKVSVDIPSGIDALSGKALGAAFKADLTVTFGFPKKGHFNAQGPNHVGALIVADIGFPGEAAEALSSDTGFLEQGELDLSQLRRSPSAHKGSFGHLLIAGGSPRLLGAAMLCAKAASHSGCGLVTLAAGSSLNPILKARLIDQMTLPLDDTYGGCVCDTDSNIDAVVSFPCSALVIGPGLGLNPATRRFIVKVLSRFEKPVIIDADALNSIRNVTDVLSKHAGRCIITPHPAEMSRIAGASKEAILENRYGYAEQISRRHGIVSILKGAYTIISCEKKTYVSPWANSALAAAGSGDVLAGITGALCARGIPPIESAKLGVYIHGLCGQIARDRLGENSVSASQIAASLPAAFSKLLAGS